MFKQYVDSFLDFCNSKKTSINMKTSRSSFCNKVRITKVWLMPFYSEGKTLVDAIMNDNGFKLRLNDKQ